MSVTDPISDLLTRIRNAHRALHADLALPASKLKAAIAGILKDEGYIADYSVSDATLSISLKYEGGKPIISGLKRMSKPGRRIYVAASDIPKVQNGLGILRSGKTKGFHTSAPFSLVVCRAHCAGCG